MLSIDTASQRERAAVAAFGLLSRDLQRQVRDETRAKVVPMAVRAATQAADTPTMRRITATGRLSVYRGVPGVAFGGTRPATSSGVPGRVLVRGLEYGGKGRYEKTYTSSSRRGRTYVLRRRTTRQFLPDRSGRPTAIYPAMESITDDVLELWVQLVEVATIKAFNGGGA